MGAWKLPTGKYLADFRDREGRRRYKSFATKHEASAWSNEMKRSVGRGEFVAPEKMLSFEQMSEQWFTSKVDRRPGTTSHWRTHLDRHLVPSLGKLPLNQIDVAMIERLRDALRAKGLAPRTVCAVLMTCGAVFKLAIRRGLVAVNPAALAERPFVGSRELTGSDTDDDRDDGLRPDQILSPQEVGRMIEHATAGLYRTLLMMAAFTGMRSGELLALQWNDVEFEPEARVFVRRSLSRARVSGETGPLKPRFYPPKTRSGARTIPQLPELVKALKVWKVQCPPGELVFPATDGTPLWRSSVLRDGLQPALRRAGLRRVTLHSLRHSFASTLIAQGAAITEVQGLCGHSSPSITLGTYSHWLRDLKTDSLAGLSSAILGGNQQRTMKSTGTQLGQ